MKTSFLIPLVAGMVSLAACNQPKEKQPKEGNARFATGPFADTFFFDNKETFILHKSANAPDTAPVYDHIDFHTSRHFDYDASFYAITAYGDTLKYIAVPALKRRNNEDDDRPILIEPTPRYRPSH